MGAVLGESLGYAPGIAISPVPIAAVILMLFSARARLYAPVFALGWLLGIAGVATVVLLIPGVGAGAGDEPSTTVGIVKAVLGLLLLLPPRPGGGRPDPAPARQQPHPGGWPASSRWAATLLCKSSRPSCSASACPPSASP